MSERKIRESTKQVTENLNKKLEIQENLKKQKKISKALGKLRQKETREYLDSAVELAEYSVEHFETSAEEEQNAESSLVKEVSPGNNENDSDDDWDPLGAIKSPRKLLGAQAVPEAEIPSASWSTKINQFFPPDYKSTPVLQRKDNARASDSGPLSPAVDLERISEEGVE